MRLAIVTTHPIQYNAPWFKLLAESENIEVMVFYTWEQSAGNIKYDVGFGKNIEWDLPLLDGYNYKFIKNIAASPGSHHFKGIINPTLNEEIEEWNPDTLLIYGWAFKSHLSCMRYFKGKIPVLFRGDSTLLDEKPGIKRILRRVFLRYVYSFVDYALCVGANNKEYFLAHGLKEQQLVFVPHAIDNDRFADVDGSADKKASEWKQELGIPSDACVIMFAGKLIPKKDPNMILELAKHVGDDRLRFIIVGNGELEASLKANTTDKRIIFLDFQNQTKMPLIYRLSDIFILPSIGPGETWGLAVNEAMASGNAIIVTSKVGCAVDLIINGQNGVVIEPGNVVAAAQFVFDFMNNRIDRKEVKRVNLSLLEKFSFTTIVKNVSALLKS